MSNIDRSINSNFGAIFIQPDGPNTALKYLDCRTLGGLQINHGSRELIQKFDAYGRYVGMGSTKGAPEMISTSMEIALRRRPDWVERLSPSNNYICQWPLYVLQRVCGRADDPTNWVRLVRLTRTDISTDNYEQLVSRNEQQESMLNVDLEAEPPAGVFHELLARRQTMSDTVAANACWFNMTTQCDPDCGTLFNPGDHGVLALDAGSGVSANVFFTFNGGTTWAASSTDPFAVDKHILSVTAVYMGNNMMRTIVSMEGPAGAQGMIGYADHAIGSAPTAWSTVNIGGATAGHGAAYGGALWSLDKEHIWLASKAGYIYFSADAGATWSAQESASIHSGSYNWIHFIDDTYGVAGGAADVLAVTTNGGASWAAATATGASSAINTVWRLDNNRLWAGTANGRLYYSNDNGVTWTRRTGFTNDGVGQMRAMSWLDEYTGFVVHNNASPVGAVRYTVDGGMNWKDVTTPTNSGLNHVFAINNNLAYYSGEIQGTTGTIGKCSLLFSSLD